MNSIQKIKYLLSPAQKKQLLVLAFLLFIGILFEMLSLGVLIPALGLILQIFRDSFFMGICASLMHSTCRETPRICCETYKVRLTSLRPFRRR